MLRLLLPVLLLLVGLGGGIGAGMMLTAPQEDTASAGPEAADISDAPETTGAGDAADAGGALFVTPAGEGTEYVRIRNQFVVPVVREGAVRSLVILALTVEITSGASDSVFQHEPRLRDSFLRVLFAHANAGGFDGVFTEADAMAPLRSGLREAAGAVLGRESVRDVLIVDITRQDA